MKTLTSLAALAATIALATPAMAKPHGGGHPTPKVEAGAHRKTVKMDDQAKKRPVSKLEAASKRRQKSVAENAVGKKKRKAVLN